MSEIKIEDLTSGLLTGDGVFDKLMEASQLRLEDAFNKGRITSTDYSNVLIQSMGSAMQQSIAYLLGIQQADAQAELTKSQTLVSAQELVNLQAQKVLLDKQALESDQQLIHLTAQTAIVTEGLATAVADTALKQQQLTNLQNEAIKQTAEIALINQNTANALTSNGLISAQSDKAVAEAENELVRKTILENQATQLVSETALIDQNTANAVTNNALLTNQVAKTAADTSLVNQNTANALTTNSLINNQSQKAVSETALLAQKRTTEIAQTANTADADSVIGKQTLLFQRQADGFLRDAEQKATKMLLDTWNVRQTTDGALTSPAGISDASIKETVASLKSGISAASDSIDISHAGGKATAATTAEGTVFVEDGTGTLYYLVSENSTETSGMIINADNTQAINAVGKQTVSATGLTATNTYFIHFVQINDNGVSSDVESSSAFVTPA